MLIGEQPQRISFSAHLNRLLPLPCHHEVLLKDRMYRNDGGEPLERMMHRSNQNILGIEGRETRLIEVIEEESVLEMGSWA
jgi:hypothetical protein